MIRYFDMFAGLGGFRAGLDRAGGFACVGHCEIDPFAQKSYRAIHSINESEVFYADARTIDPGKLPDFALLCAGFPCQPYSAAGRQRGFNDERGTLFFEITRLAKEKQPAYLLLENVPAILWNDEGRSFAKILSALCELGYSLEWQVLNSKDHGVPQSRKRVYIIGYLDGRCAGKVFPIRRTNEKTLIQIAGGRRGRRIYDPNGLSCTLTSGSGGMGGKTGLYAVGFNRKDGVTKRIDAAYALNASNFRGLNRNQTQNAVFVDMTYGNPKVTDTARCLTSHYAKSCFSKHNGEKTGVLLSQGRIRRLTPRECFRLQSFSENQIDKLLAIISDSQAYKLAGNSVTVNVIHALGLRIRAMHEELQKGGCSP